MTTTTTDSNYPTFKAEEINGEWTVLDTDGGRWWPSDEAAEEISASDRPDVAALRICADEPMRGEWVQ